MYTIFFFFICHFIKIAFVFIFISIKSKFDILIFISINSNKIITIYCVSREYVSMSRIRLMISTVGPLSLAPTSALSTTIQRKLPQNRTPDYLFHIFFIRLKSLKMYTFFYKNNFSFWAPLTLNIFYYISPPKCSPVATKNCWRF